MSVLINLYRQLGCVRYKEGETVFGDIVEGADPLTDASSLTPFDIELNKLKFRLQQACRHGDFGETFATGEAVKTTEKSEFEKLVEKFNDLTLYISTELQILTPEEAKSWLDIENNKTVIKELVDCLGEIYQHRTCGTIWRERILNVAEPLFAVLALVGLVAGIMKVAGTGILGGAFAHYATPETTLGIMKVTGATSLTVASFCAFFCTEKHNLKSSISESVAKKKIAAPSGSPSAS